MPIVFPIAAEVIEWIAVSLLLLQRRLAIFVAVNGLLVQASIWILAFVCSSRCMEWLDPYLRRHEN